MITVKKKLIKEMIAQYFSSGNYKNWEDLIKLDLPAIDNLIKGNIVPMLDSILYNMLGMYAYVLKRSINISMENNNDFLSGIFVDLVYEIGDFKVEDAPEDAIEADEQAIAESLNSEAFTVSYIDIDVKTGELTLKLYIPLTPIDEESSEKEED